jgi:hypothetical protein
MTTSPGHAAAYLARLVEGRSARRLAPRISTTSVDANLGAARERQDAHHVVRQREPQGDGRDLGQAPDRELAQAAVAGLGVGIFRRRRSLLVDRARWRAGYALALGGDRRAVVGARLMTVAVLVLGHRHVGGRAGRVQGRDVGQAGIAAVR